MKGDFSRIRFEPGKHYTDVLKQQGRTELDADGNEQRFIDDYRLRTETVDVIGKYGAPMSDPGFAITVAGNRIQIGAGRYYVDGLLCENAKPLRYDDQPYLIDTTTHFSDRQWLEELIRSEGASCLCVWLEVWQRMVTALDDTCLGEPALGQADTTVRMQTVWRVVACLETPTSGGRNQAGRVQSVADKQVIADNNDANAADANARVLTDVSRTGNRSVMESTGCCMDELSSCCRSMYEETTPKHDGTLSAQTAANSGDCGCQPIPAAGYVGLENQLYRVEIHESGDLASATFKWSRENASVVVAVLAVSGCTVTVNSLGMDANLGFQVGQWVEISDDTNLFGETPNQTGTLYQIQNIDQPSSTLTMSTTVQSVDTMRNARMRRWDQTDITATDSGIPISGSWIDLENGIQVCFGRGDYVSGDAWTIPARSATGTIDWPPCGSDGKPYQPPYYAKIYRAPLACIHDRDANDAEESEELSDTNAFAYESRFKVDDCRRQFPSLTDLSCLTDANALHITAINWKNDDVMTLDKLVKSGLSVKFDQAPAGPFTPANFIVTLETPIFVTKDDDNSFRSAYAFSEQGNAAAMTTGSTGKSMKSAMTKASAGNTAKTTDANLLQFNFSMPTVLRSEAIIDSTIKLLDDILHWTLPYNGASAFQKSTILAIDVGLLVGMASGIPARARVKLPGRMLYASPSGGSQIYLDGQAFGQTAKANIGSRDRIDLLFPTGSSDKASNFESWFYLYPILAVSEVDLSYSALTVSDSDGDVSIVASTPTATTTPVVQKAMIQLNYPAVEAATITLSLNGDATVASVPSSVAVKVGDECVSVDITIDGAPADEQTESFTLTASIANAIGTAISQSATFTVTGQAPPVQLQ